jgi:uncharacterized protein (DUF1778 family)
VIHINVRITKRAKEMLDRMANDTGRSRGDLIERMILD